MRAIGSESIADDITALNWICRLKSSAIAYNENGVTLADSQHNKVKTVV